MMTRGFISRHRSIQKGFCVFLSLFLLAQMVVHLPLRLLVAVVPLPDAVTPLQPAL